MKRSGSIPRKTPLRQRSRLKPRSAKQVQIDAARRVLKARLIAEDPLCRRCRMNDGQILHEVLRRSQGGDPTSELVAVLICQEPCHGWIHRNPTQARETGWLVYRKDLLGLEAA